MVVRRAVSWMLVALAGCGGVDIADGTVQCSVEGECPPGFGCRDDGFCYRSAGGGGGTPDGAADGSSSDGADPLDGAPPIDTIDAPPDARVDATPVGCTSDTPCNPFDNYCADYYCDLADNLCKANPINQGSQCMPRECPTGFGGCSGDGSCNETGSQSRTCQDFTCQGVNCIGNNVIETQNCPIDTDGNSCGSDFCGSYPAGCPDDLADECDENGTRSRPCYARRCGGGNCNDVQTGTQTENCTRPTGGNPCGAVTTCDPNFDGTCGDCVEARTCTDFACSGGVCQGTPRIDTRPCAPGAFCSSFDCGGGCFLGICCDGGGSCSDFGCGVTCADVCGCPLPPCPIP